MLIAALPWRAVVTGIAVLAAGALVRLATTGRRTPA
jgi:hypothetical protein